MPPAPHSTVSDAQLRQAGDQHAAFTRDWHRDLSDAERVRWVQILNRHYDARVIELMSHLALDRWVQLALDEADDNKAWNCEIDKELARKEGQRMHARRRVYELVIMLLALLLAGSAARGQSPPPPPPPRDGGGGGLTAADFTCFITAYAAGQAYANCDSSTGAPVLTGNDFACFITRFAAGDPRADCDGSLGWTALAAPPGAQVFYVASNGSDTNPGTQAAPFRSLQRGYAALRNGQPDQLLLRCGDTWNEAAQLSLTKSGSATAYQVIGSYGTGPRPKIVYGNTSGFRADPGSGVRSLAIVDIELEHHPAYTGRLAPLTLIEVNDILVEGCYIHGGTDNIIVQTINPNAGSGVPSGIRSTNIKLRRNVIADASNQTPGDMRGQGAYIQDVDGLLIEENVSVNNGDPVIAAGNTNTGRNWYIHETCNSVIYRDNVGINGFDGDAQLRPGAICQNNLVMQCPTGLYVGYKTGTNTIQWNVVLESGDINSVDRRGRGIHFNGLSIVRYNVIAYNTGTGWGAVHGFYLSGASGELSGNYCYDWTRDPALGGLGDSREGQGIQIVGGGDWKINSNRVFQIRHGIVMEPDDATIGGSGNTYWAPPDGLGDFRPFATFAGWTKLAWAPADPNLRTLLPGASIAAYTALCRGQSRANWNTALTADAVNDTIRLRVGVEPNP